MTGKEESQDGAKRGSEMQGKTDKGQGAGAFFVTKGCVKESDKYNI